MRNLAQLPPGARRRIDSFGSELRPEVGRRLRASSGSWTATSCAAFAARRSVVRASTRCRELPSRSRCTSRPMCCSARRTAMTAHAAERADVLLVGNPNSGKSLLFTRLTGIAQKVANYPGVTTEVRSGHAGGLVIHDYPGIYSLEPLTLDERVAIERLEMALADPHQGHRLRPRRHPPRTQPLPPARAAPPRPRRARPGHRRGERHRRAGRPERPPRSPRAELRARLPRHRHLGQDRAGPRRPPDHAPSPRPRAALGRAVRHPCLDRGQEAHREAAHPGVRPARRRAASIPGAAGPGVPLHRPRLAGLLRGDGHPLPGHLHLGRSADGAGQGRRRRDGWHGGRTAPGRARTRLRPGRGVRGHRGVPDLRPADLHPLPRHRRARGLRLPRPGRRPAPPSAGMVRAVGTELPPAPLGPRLRHPGDDGGAHHRVAPPAADHGDGHPVHLLLGAPSHLRAAHRRLRPGGQPGARAGRAPGGGLRRDLRLRHRERAPRRRGPRQAHPEADGRRPPGGRAVRRGAPAVPGAGREADSASRPRRGPGASSAAPPR